MTTRKVRSALTASRTVGVLATLLLVMLAGSARSEAALDPCTSIQLSNITRERPQSADVQRRRAAALSAGLSCPNVSAYPMVAAAAAYELSLFYAGATGLDPADLPRAIDYARKSAELLRSTGDRKLWFKTSLAVARLQMHAAKNLEALVEARKSLEALSTELQGAAWAPAVGADYYQLLAELNESIFQRGDGTARAGALSAIDRYLGTETGRKQTAERSNALETRARLLAPIRVEEGAERTSDLGAAVAAFEEAIDLYRKLGSRNDRLRTQVNLATACIHAEGPRYGENLEKAIAILKSALTEMNPRRERQSYIEAANSLGSAFMARQQGERNQNMLDAVRWFRIARKQLDPSQQDEQSLWVRTSVNLAMALEATKVAEEKALQEADEVLAKTIAWLEERQRFEETVKPLAVQLAIRLTWASWGNAEQLDAAATLLAKAEQRSAHRPAARRASLQADRGDYLRYRFASGDAAALDQAIAAYRAAIALTNRQESPSAWASMQNNLGNACNTRGRPDLYQCAFDAYQQALHVRTAAAMPREHADTLVNLANLEFEKANWQQAAELYTTLARRHRSLFDTIEQRAVLLTSASQSKRWFERAAYALAKLGRAEEGLWIAEQGKTRLLKRRLGLKDLSDDGAQRDGLAGLHARVGTLIMVPIVSTKGGLVFALFRSPQGWVLKTVFLDGLDADAVVAFMQGGRQVSDAKAGWLGAYQEFVGKNALGTAPQFWTAKLRESQAWLGARLVAPALAGLRAEGISPTVVTWVTQGELAVLPIHAALMDDGKTLVEHLPVMYAPSLSLLLPSPPEVRPPRQPKDLRLVAVGNPTSDPDLLLSELEARSAFSRLPSSNAILLTSGRATSASVKQAMRRAQVFHFAGHASFNREYPQQSHLLLANNERLTVADVQATVGASGPNLVILSSCESGLIQIFDIANEFQGLPAAFLGLGAKGVVSSLWPIDDGPTLFLIDRLMEAKITRDQPIPNALREAQLWLMEVRGGELAKVARRLAVLAQDSATKARLAKLIWLFEHKPEWQPYADPKQWAGFFYSGRDLHEIGNDLQDPAAARLRGGN